MAITQTGTIQTFDLGTFNKFDDVGAPVINTVTVPADAELAVVTISSYVGTANFFSGGQVTLTKGGSQVAMTVGVTGANGADNDTSKWMSALWYMALPDTGSNKVIQWDWSGAGVSTETVMLSVTFWKGINTGGPVRDCKGAQFTSTPYTTPTLTAQSGDLIVGWSGFFSDAGEGSINSWTNAALITNGNLARVVDTDGAWASGSPSGNTTIAAATATPGVDGAILGLVLIPAAGGSTLTPGAGSVPFASSAGRLDIRASNQLFIGPA